MSNPQIENGYTKLANEILERLCFPGINGSEYRILNSVIRKTYGFHKKKDRIPISQFQKLTKMNRPQTVRTIRSLVSKRILIKNKGTYAFNKNWEEWVVSKRGSIQKDTGGSIQLDTKVVSNWIPSKEIQKKDIKKLAPQSGAEGVSQEIPKKKEKQFNPQGAEVIKALESVDPKNKTYYGNKTQRAAADFLIAEYGIEEVLRRIPFLRRTNAMPYIPKINSPYDLKEKWIKLEDALKTKRAEVEISRPKVAFI